MRILRILTILAICGASGLAMILAFGVLHFSLIKDLIAVPTSADFAGSIGVPGVRYAARDAMLTAMSDASQKSDAKSQVPDAKNNSSASQKVTNSHVVDTISSILSIKPLSAGYWLSLAKLRYETGAANSDTVKAFAMSRLTGPNEGHLLPSQSLFGLAIVDIAPADMRSEMIGNFAAVLPRLSTDELSNAKEILVKEKEEIREEVRSRLIAQGASTDRLAAIGLPNS